MSARWKHQKLKDKQIEEKKKKVFKIGKNSGKEKRGGEEICSYFDFLQVLMLASLKEKKCQILFNNEKFGGV